MLVGTSCCSRPEGTPEKTLRHGATGCHRWHITSLIVVTSTRFSNPTDRDSHDPALIQVDDGQNVVSLNHQPPFRLPREHCDTGWLLCDAEEAGEAVVFVPETVRFGEYDANWRAGNGSSTGMEASE